MRVRTTCNRDCPDACGIVATVESGRIVKLQGDPGPSRHTRVSLLPDQPLPRAAVRPRPDHDPASAAERVVQAGLLGRRARSHRGEDAPDQIRIGPCGDPALPQRRHARGHEVHQRRVLRAVRPVRGEERRHLLGGGGRSTAHRLRRRGQQRHLRPRSTPGRSCSGGRTRTSATFTSFRSSRRPARKGTRIVLIDPVRHRGAELAELHVQPRPGGDIALALGIARRLVRERQGGPDRRHLLRPSRRVPIASRSRAAWRIGPRSRTCVPTSSTASPTSTPTDRPRSSSGGGCSERRTAPRPCASSTRSARSAATSACPVAASPSITSGAERSTRRSRRRKGWSRRDASKSRCSGGGSSKRTSPRSAWCG